VPRNGGHSARVNRAAADDWIRTHVEPAGPIELEHEAAWATVLRVPLDGGVCWFKACGAVQAFEPRLTAALFSRWPDRVAKVIAHDDARAWILLAHAGTPIAVYGSPPEAWLVVLPAYAELQRGETVHADDHLAHGVPDLRLAELPARYESFVQSDLPLDDDELERLRGFVPRFAELCAELATHGVAETIQHDDLHYANVYDDGGTLRVLDWGDSSVAHPFFTLVETFRFLEHVNGLRPGDPFFARLRAAYLEPWGDGHEETFELALRIGELAHSLAWLRQRDHLPEHERREFDKWFPVVLRRAVAQTYGTSTRSPR
jgi:hypothetical protein